ncbi:MAG: hypothetical protein ACSLFK_03285, partial [Gemmatimonadaceae bacterium]
MSIRRAVSRTFIAASALVAVACTDSPAPSEPGGSPSYSRSGVAQDRLAALFPETSADIMALPHTVFADHDEVQGKLVFGVENASAIAGIERSLIARGLSASEFSVKVVLPIVRLANLQTTAFRPTQAGTQIHFGGYVCTLGFNVSHGSGRSFITNSHCTNTQGGTEGTTYAQPARSIDPTVIATEADDPVYVSGNGCSAGKVCRWSDASRALYSGSVASSQGVIAKTTGVNTGSLTTNGNFTITSQNNSGTSFSGTVNKVGRTTGWTAGTVGNTCVTVNVSGSNVQLRCQTLVNNSSATIVSGGDSGSPVFQITSGDNVTLVGILWGGSGTSTFVFSPLKQVQDELGPVVATSGGG